MVNFLGLGLLVLFVPKLTAALGSNGHACVSGGYSSNQTAPNDHTTNPHVEGNCPGQANLLYLFT